MSHTTEIQGILSAIILGFDSELPISAEAVAAEAIDKMDPDNESPVLVRWGCVLEVRQLSRAILRREYEEDGIEGRQGDMFAGILQDRYPGFGDHAGKYMPRELMSQEDYERNIARLRREAEAKQEHADALQAEMDARFGVGYMAA